MYAQFFNSSDFSFTANQANYQNCIIGGNWLMLVSLLITLACLFISYGVDQYFSIASQVAAHISTVLFAGLFKIGYVIRCVGVHGLGYKVF
ncbi:hypothetical protein [Thalassotalea sp. Y01]|uniref:hypothetical protein n=1 Tax=Thalassotalea sp. Y01 TaxID=2729613 RepID=UPI00145D7747|nr:hypothetical protein [Thalassotalea sp. Y01]NMP17593.1 hypothetical protein [Thalassotalea sp. Y01]